MLLSIHLPLKTNASLPFNSLPIGCINNPTRHRQHNSLPPRPLKPSTNICGNGVLALIPINAQVMASTNSDPTKPKTYLIQSTQSGATATNCSNITGCASSNASITPQRSSLVRVERNSLTASTPSFTCSINPAV